jgi:hypothetical protein
MAKFTLEDTIKTFTTHQAIVVYWFCKGLSNQDIADMYGYEPSWVVWQFSMVYFKLGLDRKQANGRKLHWTERRRVLREKVCPIMDRLTNDDPDFLERFPLIAPNVLEGSILDLRPDIPVPPSEPYIPPPEPPSDPPPLPPADQNPPSDPPPDFYPIELYNAWLAVLEDDKHGDAPPSPPPVIVRPPERRGIVWSRIIVLGLTVLLGCIAVGALAYWFGIQRGSPSPTPILASSTQAVPVTETFTDTTTIRLTVPPAETLAPTLTSAPTPTITPVPTDTKSPLDLRVGDVLEDARVTLRLTKVGYNEGYDRIGARRAPISYYFDFTNHSGDTIVLQFDQYDFVNEDDTGGTANCWFFHISGAGPAVNEPLANGATRQIIARCGDGQLNPAVNVFTLTVHPFSSLPESKWKVEIPR